MAKKLPISKSTTSADKTSLYMPSFDSIDLNFLQDKNKNYSDEKLQKFGLIKAHITTDKDDIPVLVNLSERVCFPMPK